MSVTQESIMTRSLADSTTQKPLVELFKGAKTRNSLAEDSIQTDGTGDSLKKASVGFNQSS